MAPPADDRAPDAPPRDALAPHAPRDAHLQDPGKRRRWRQRALDKGLQLARQVERLMNGLEVRLENLPVGVEAKAGETPLQRLRRYLDQVDRVVKSFDAGTFGRCPECGAVIPEERLEELPWAERCERCARAG